MQRTYSELGRRTFHTLDGLRGVAAICVVIYHYDLLMRPFLLPSAYLAVDLFFMLSGVVIAHAYDDRLREGLSTWRFAVMRFIRLYPLYFVGWALSTLAMTAAIATHLAPNWNWADLASSVGFGAFMLPSFLAAPRHSELYPLNHPAWSLLWELVGNVAFAATFKLQTRRNLIVFVALMAVIATAVTLTRGTIDGGRDWQDGGVAFVRLAFSFALGVLIGRSPRAQAKFSHFVPYALAASTVLVFVLPSHLGPLRDLGVVFIAFPTLIVLALRYEPGNARPFYIIGLASYPLYAIHLTLPTVKIMNVVLRRPAETFAPWIGLAFLFVVFCIALALAVWFDPPARRWLTSQLIPQSRLRGPDQGRNSNAYP